VTSGRLILALASAVVTAAVPPTAVRADACTDTIIAECTKEFPDSWGGLGLSLRGYCMISGIIACKST
jgi:hypothetical protein